MPDEKRNSRRSNSVANLLATALVSGTVCYRLGTLHGYASHWLTNINAAESSFEQKYVTIDVDNDDPNAPSYFRSGGNSRTSSPPKKRKGSPPKKRKGSPTEKLPLDRRLIPRTSVPYDCGVVFFYHIPCTGGASINRWFRKYQRPQNGNHSYYQEWAVETRRNGTFHPEPERIEAKFAKGMSDHIQNLGPNEWRIAHSHLLSTYLNESEDLLFKWRSDVEAQGCEMINTVMLRDPLNHAMSLHKIVKHKNSTQEEWTKYLASPTEHGLWASVLDFFLYNNHGLRHHKDYVNGPGGRNPFNVTKEAKVTRAMELLHRHFDVVTVSNHDAFREKILNWTGWTPMPIKPMNIFKGELRFTKKEVEWMQKGLQKNGDFDFVDQAKLEYHDYLSYLDR